MPHDDFNFGIGRTVCRQGAGKYSVLELAAKEIMSYLPVPYAWITNAVGVDHMQGVCLGVQLQVMGHFHIKEGMAGPHAGVAGTSPPPSPPPSITIQANIELGTKMTT